MNANGAPRTGRDPGYERDLAAAHDAFELEAVVPGLWPEAEVVLLPTSDPVELEASIRRALELPARWREGAVRIAWSASAGEIVERFSEDTRRSRAVWTPPEDAILAEISVEATIQLEPTAAAPGPDPAIVLERLMFRFLTPAASTAMADGRLLGYELGEYPDIDNPHLGGSAKWPRLYPERYRRPAFFHRVSSDEQKSLHISPHVTLGHFTIDYPWGSLGMPQLIAVDLNLVQKIEDLIARMRADGRTVSGIVPIYGFRPPRFNQESIRDRPGSNLKVEYSMHQYGRAMDFIIDEDGDLVMDDLNGDGVHDIRDAAVILHYVNILDREYRAANRWDMVGGAGIYEFHDFVGRPATPYLHMDTRGFESDTMGLIRWKEPPPANWPDGTPIKWGSI